MKQIYSVIVGLVLFMSCSPDDIALYDNAASVEDIKILELRADHKTLIPNGTAQMQFYVKAYGISDFLEYTDGKNLDTLTFTEQMVRDTFEIPMDLLPGGYIKVYDENGKMVDNNVFSTTQTGERTLNFYAQAGDLKSEPLSISVRALPDESYEELVIPVIFHVIVPPTSSGPSYAVTTEDLQRKLDRVNDIFNRRATTDPNGGNLKVTFKMAEYDKNGIKLIEKGKNEVVLKTALSARADYEAYIKTNLIWDPTKFMNIWVAKFSNSISDGGESTYRAAAPTIRMEGTEPIKGLTTKEVTVFNVKDGYDYRESGFMVNYHELLNPNAMSSNLFEVATAFSVYMGLSVTEFIKYTNKTTNIVDGDTDYCPDTYYYFTGEKYIYKHNDLGVNSVGAPKEFFTSFNVMDRYSRKNSISADQAARARKVLESCPSRWSYKSDFAFTGKK